MRNASIILGLLVLGIIMMLIPHQEWKGQAERQREVLPDTSAVQEEAVGIDADSVMDIQQGSLFSDMTEYTKEIYCSFGLGKSC